VTQPAKRTATGKRRAREKKVPAFGAMLIAARGKMTQGRVVRAIRAALREGFSSGTLTNWEQGTVTKPDPVALYELARVYGGDFSRWLAVLLANRQNPGSTEIPMPVQEGSDMKTIGPDEMQLLARYRGLKPKQQHELLEFAIFLERSGQGGAAGTGSAATTFRRDR
jgi:transcriptional regulator with XRE-family HTH domain